MKWPFQRTAQPAEVRMAVGVEDFFGRPMEGPARVTHDSAAGMAPIFSAVRLIAETVASLPVGVVQAMPDGTRERVDHPINALLESPNQCMTRFEFVECAVSHQELRGNSFNEVIRDGMGRPVALWPLKPGVVRAERKGAGVVYRVSTTNGEVVAGPDRILHLKFATLSPDGVTGTDPVQLLRADLSAAAGARDFARNFFENGAAPSGVLTHPAVLGDKAAENLRKQFKARYSGSKNSGATLLLEEGLEWKPTGTNPENSQLLESRNFSIQDVSRIWRIPPHFLSDPSLSTYATATAEAESLVKNTLRPRICRLEQALDRALLTPGERAAGLGIRFQLDALLRGSTLERYQTYSLGIRDGWLSRGEVRVLEDRPAVTGLDEFVLMPGMGAANNGGGQPGAENKPNG